MVRWGVSGPARHMATVGGGRLRGAAPGAVGGRRRGECAPVGDGGAAALGAGEGGNREAGVGRPPTRARTPERSPLTLTLTLGLAPRGIPVTLALGEPVTLTLTGPPARDGVDQLAVRRTWRLSPVGAGVPGG